MVINYLANEKKKKNLKIEYWRCQAFCINCCHLLLLAHPGGGAIIITGLQMGREVQRGEISCQDHRTVGGRGRIQTQATLPESLLTDWLNHLPVKSIMTPQG